MYKSFFRLSILFIIVIYSSISTYAATLTVSNLNDSGAGSLRQAVIDAVEDDTIVFSVTGTITLTSGQIIIDKNVNIVGPGAANLAIDGNNSSRIFEISNTSSIEGVRIYGVTIQNGRASNGGAIFVGSDSYFDLHNSVVSGSTSTSNGGGIYIEGSALLYNSTVAGNHATLDGGGIYSDGGLVSLTNSTISGNSSDRNGGGITIDDTTFAGDFLLYNNTVSGNHANLGGGGIAIVNNNAKAILHNNTVSNNTSNIGATAIQLSSGGTVVLSNSIVSGNGLTPIECSFSGGTVELFGNNILGTNGFDNGCAARANDIIPAGPIFTILDPLSNNGGPTETHALVPDGPAIDASNPGTYTDQRGVPAQGIRDIGAFESGADPTYPTIEFNSTGATYNETDGWVYMSLTISGAVNFTGRVVFLVVDAMTGSATFDSDYDTVDPHIRIECDVDDLDGGYACDTGETITFPVIIKDDTLLENDETVHFVLFGGNGFVNIGTQSTFVVTIQDAATATISANDATATENPVDNGQFTVDLGEVNDTGSAITVNYSISGTATDGVDYTTLAGSVDVADGQQTAIIDIIPKTDVLFEGSETVELTLTSTNHARVSVDTTPATVTITDSAISTATISANDPDGAENPVDNGQFTVDLGSVNDTGSAITVNYSISGTATDGVDYTTLAGSVDVTDGQQTATIDIVPITDVLFEGSETVELTLTSTNDASVGVDTTPATVTTADSTISTATISANDPDGAENPVDNGQFTVDLGIVNNTGSAITVNYSISGTATNGTDYITLTGSVDVADGQQTTILDVIPLDDTTVEGSETVELTLSSTNHASVSVDTSPAIVTIADDERRSEDASTSTTDTSQVPDISSNSNSDAMWEITITANPSFALPGGTVTFTITVRKLSGGTPVTMEFPISDNFTIQSVSSNRGAVSFAGQTVTYNDDIHVGDTPVITVNTILNPNLSSPFTLTEQSCIVSPTTLCASTTLASVTQLPSTGETPIWRDPLMLILALSGLLSLAGAGVILRRRIY